MAKKPLQTLYESLRASNYDVPDNYGSFERTLTAPGKEGVRNRQTLYKALRDNNYDVPDTYESFSRTLFSPVKPTGGTAASGQSMLPADVEERRMRTRKPQQTHPLNKSRARQRLQAQQQAIENQQKRWEQQNQEFKEDIARREQRLPGGMDRFEERAKEHLATGEAAPVPLAPNDEVVRGDIVFNPDTGRMEQTYTTPEGGMYFDRNTAEFEHQLDNLPADEIELLEREQELIGMGILRRGRELEQEYESQSWWDKFMAGLATDPEMGPGPRERMAEDDEELQSLLAAWRKNRDALRIMYDKRNNDMNSFWHNFGTTVANGYTFTGGEAELHDAQAILNSSKRMDEIQRKIEAGEKLSNVENAALSLAQNTAWDNAIQAMYGDDYGAWATAGGAAVQSLEMMPEFIAGMPVLKGMGTAAIKLLTRNAAKGFGRFMLKGLGMTLGTMAGGAIMANTIQAERTLGKAAGKAAGSWWFGDDGEFMLGHYDGDQFVSGGESLAAALFHAEQEAIPEAASEGAGEFLPGIGQVLSKIGLSRIAKPLASLSGKGWYKTYQNMLRAAGWHGVGGEALEEYVGTLDGLIMGDVEGVKRLADPRTHFDIWLSCATLGPLLNAPVVLGSSMRGVYSPVAYHKLKAAVTRQDKIASFRLTEDRWAPWRDRIDNTPNEQMADLMVEIRDDQDLAPQEKKAIFDYVKALQGYRGWNLGEYIFGKDAEEDGEGKTEQEQQQSQEYSNGYETVTPEERRAAKDRLDVARARLEQKGYSEQWMQWLDNAPAEDVMNDLTERGLAGDTEAVMEYLNAKSAYDGMLQRVNDDIDDEVAVANEAIDQRIAPEDQGGDGMIHPAVLKGGREVFIISGNVATLADNSIDVENSDGMIIVRDAEGNEDTISPDNIQSLGEVIDPAQQRQDAEQMIIDEQGQAAAAQIEGQLPFNVGDQYTISYQGEPHTYQVVQADENNVAVLVDGAQEPVVLTRQQLQQMADEEHAQQIQAQAAAADTVEEEPAAVEPEQPVEAAAVEETPAAPVVPEDNPTAAMPMDDQGEPAWDQVEPERGHQFLYQESGWPQAMADNFVQKRIDDAEKALKKAQDAGQKLIDNPKPTFSAQQQAVAENTAAQQAAQSALDYWKGVQGIQAQATAPVVEETAPVVETPAEQEPTEQATPVAETEAPAEPEASEPVEETPAVETPAPVAENEMQPVEVEQPAEAAPAEPVEESAPQSDAIPEQPAEDEGETTEEIIQLLKEEFADVLDESVEIVPESVKAQGSEYIANVTVDGEPTNIWLSHAVGSQVNEHYNRIFIPLYDYEWHDIDELAIEYNALDGKVCEPDSDVKRINFKDVWEATQFEGFLASREEEEQEEQQADSESSVVADIQYSIESQGEVPKGEKPKAFKMGEVTSNDGNRNGYALGVYHDPSGTAVATDGYIMIVDSREYDVQHKGKVIAQSNIKKGSEVKEPIKKGEEVPVERYPNWKSVFPKKKDTDSVKVNFNALCGWLAGVEKRMKEQWQQWKQEHPGEKMSFDNWRSRSAIQILMPDGKVQQFKFDNLYTFARAAASQGAKTLRYYPNQDNRAFSFDSKFGSGLVMPYNMEHYSYIDNPYRVDNGLGVDLDSSLFTYDMSNGLMMPGKTAGNRVELNYESGKDAESRAYIEEVMEREGWDEDAKSEFRKILDDAADLVSRMAQGFTRLREWNNKKLTDEQGNYNPLWRVFDKDDGWIPTRSSFKKNGEYPYNIDLGALCTKREAFDAVVRYIKEQGWGQNLGPTQIEALKSLLREHGFLTACDICFNETRRARALDYGNAVAYYWNAVRQAVGIDDDLPIGTPRELTEEQMKRLTELSKSGKAFSKYVPKELRRTYETYVNTKGQTKRREVDKGLTPTMTMKVAKLFLQDPSLMGKFEGTMVLSTDSVDALVRQFPHTDIARFLAGAWGSNTPKPNEGFNIYDPLSWKQTYDKKRQRPAMEWFFNLGGMRAQSFSDYSPIFFYDYVQMFTDLAIRRLPIHIYTKVPALIKLFGGTGAKFNMSLVPEVVQGVDAEHLGLKPDGNGGWVYAWHEDSFPVDEAFALRQDPRFNGNVGTIAVGISDAHIRMLLDDPTIDMVIPYHKSGMPPSIQVKTGLDKATDYTDDQHSKKRGKALKNDFSFNEALRRLGDPRKAADEYLAWCKENNYTPKYPQFADHPNYYKVLEDFRCIDNEGNYSPQQPVQVSFFDDVEQRLSESLADRTMQEGLDNAIRGNDAITEGIKKIMSKPRLDGKIRDMMLARLKQVLGKDNVASLKQEDFFEELQKVYTDQMGAERAQQQVEVLRTSGGIVYGFAVGDRIVLNENYFNAETPMHEFTHVWVKVARLANPQMWAEGKELLKQTKEWQEVMNDEFYRDIQGDEDAVASEVLARIVGQDAARQINEMFAPEDKPQERPGIYNKIKQWVNQFLDGVRSLFDSKAKGLTYDELVRMPMKALFDDAEAARFMEALAQVNEEDVDLSSQGSVPTFYSNAARAVEGVKQEKAKAEQWKAMLTKAGGIKAGEDKWMGLSTWLDEHKGETLTKEQVRQFVAENGIQMEEVNYGDKTSEIKKGLDDFANEFDSIVAQKKEEGSENDVYDEAFADMVEKYGEDFDMAFMVSKTNFPESSAILVPVREYGGELSDAAKYFLGVDNQEDNLINKTRLDYTTPGLENKREIAFVVPNVEPYQETDEIHFGPENQGRAVMWVRFGETRDTDGNRVLVIDEIQSNRHQDAREKGYKKPIPEDAPEVIAYNKANKEYQDYLNGLREKYGTQDLATAPLTEEEERRKEELTKVGIRAAEERFKFYEANGLAKFDKGVPAAPFEKNWHEVAMKRMLRLAAEEGFDKVAWTTGEQQARRYDLGQVIDKIVFKKETGAPFGEPDRIFYPMKCYKDGELVKEFSPAEENLEELVGRDIANEMKASGFDGENTIEKDLITGNVSGMQGFYDKMLPQFMNKYGKRWGVKVGEVTLDTPGKETMHSVDVTPEMRRSVMTEGQPLFQIKGVNKSEERTLMGMHNITAEKLRSALKLGGLANPSMAVINTEVGGFTNFGEISLIPSADLIASRTGGNAGTWGADAYSPRFPETHRRLGNGGDKKLSKWVKGLKMRQEMEYNTEEQFNDYYNGFNIRDNALVYPFLHEKGLSGEVDYYNHMNVDQRLEDDLREVNGDQWALLKRFDEDDAYKQKLTDIVVGDELKKINKKEGETFQEYRDRRRELAKEIRETLTEEDGYINRNLAEDLLYAQARAYRENAKFSESRTRDNAEQYIRDHGLEEEYKQYFDDKMQELGAETQIYAGSDSQGRSKFKAADLDQVSKQMKKKGRAGGEGGIFEDSPGAIRAKLLTPMKTLDQIRKNKGRIVDHEQFEKAREDYQNELREYADTYARGSMGALADILTSRNMQATARQYNIDLDADAVADLNGFKDRVRALPTEYFETKFERPVMLDEFKKAVVPDNLPLDLYGALQRSGLEIVQYPAGDTAARERVTLDAVKDDEDIRFRDDDGVAEHDREYREAVEKKDDAAAQKLVDDAAKAAGMATDESGKLIDLYHGTGRFGFTIFDRLKSRMGAFFTSTRRNVAANYAGDDHYAGVRKINKGYKQDDSQEGIMNNARSVFDQDWKMATEEQKQAIVTKVEADARKVTDEIEKRQADVETLPADDELDIFNATAWVMDLFYTVAYAKENGNEGEDLYRLVADGVERYNENKQVIRDYVSKHYDELDEKQKNYLNYLTGWDSGDVAIDIECSYKRVVSGKDLATVTGDSMLTLDELKKNTDEAHNIGAYHLFGNLGDNPLIVDAEGKNWYSLEYEGRKFDTDTLAQYAKENGYTALVVKNVYDYGDKADDYIFFEPSQLKSADPATYDDNGELIPLSQRFDLSVDDMRFRSILEDGGTLKVYQREGKWRVEGVPGEFDTQFGAVDNARNFLQGHVFEVAEDGNSIEVLGAGSNLDNMLNGRGEAATQETATDAKPLTSKERKAEERARKWRERTVANGRRRVEELGQRLGVKVTIVDDIGEQEREDMSKKKRRAKGWYDVRTGEVFINLGNHRTVSDIEATFLHEVVAHKGLRRLFGDEFDTFLHNVYYNVDASIREEINRLMAKNNWDYREATEEYLAKLAQQMNFERPEKYVKAWETVARLFRTLLQKMGLGNGMNLKDSDLRGILFESYHNMEKEGVAGLAESVEFRDAMEQEANSRVNNATYQTAQPDVAAVASEPEGDQTKSANFKRWFGDWENDPENASKVVDTEGKPLVVYHGTQLQEYYWKEGHPYTRNVPKFYTFNSGFFTPDREAGLQFARGSEHRLYPVYLDIKNPLIIDAKGQPFDSITLEDGTKTSTDGIVYDARRSGKYDGVIIRNVKGEDNGNIDRLIDDYIPFDPTQIKSATENNGDFDPNNPDIRFRDDEDDVEDFEDSEDFYEEELEEEADNAEDLGEEVDDSEAGASTFQEMMLGKMLQAANSAGAAQSARVSAMRSLGGALQQIRKAMSTQRNYDRETVNTIVRLAREVMASGYFNDLTRGEVKRLLAAAKNANGSANVTEQANKVVDTLLRHHLRECENLLKKQLKVKGSKTNASGVEVQAGLDIEGQRMATAMKQGMRLDEQGLSDRVADCLSRMGSSDPVVSSVAAQEYTGLMLAQQYHDTIKASRQEEQQMREEMRQAKAEFAARRDSLSPEELKRQRQDLKDYIAATEDAIRQNRMERADAYNQLSEMLGGGIASSMERAKQWREQQRERVGDIQHNANSDLEGVPADEHMKPTWKHHMANWAVVRFFMKPLATFDYMLRMMGQKSPNGEGYLWNRFMGGWVEANDKEWRNVKAAHQVLDEKVKEMFNADRPGLPKFKVKRWSDLFFIERKMKGMDVDFWDDDRIKTRTLTPGNLLYIYMANKMSDGKMKLRKMGISEEDVEAIENHLDPRLIELADWLQDEFLVQKRIEYNAVHERMFGAPMAAIENYFPLKINKLSRSQEEDVNNQDANPDENRGSTITGAIIKRVRNNKALDVTRVDAFDVILEHIQTMEHWAAFAEFNRDLNALLSYKRFRNRMYNMASARFGSGEKLWTNFKRVCAIASGVYRPRVDRDSVDTSLVNVAKGVTRAKISFRFYTALKQLLSYPAYLSTANPIELIKSSNPVGAVKAWNWAIDNLPGFAERWQSRQAGDTRLKESDADWGLWKSKIIDTASRWGMSPNAFIDGLTVAMGAKAIYETKFKQLKKLGYSEEQAKQRALRDASVSYNETQQSSANAYTSAMQLDRTAASVALTVFRNASMGYQRRLFQSFANLKHMATKGYKEQSLYYLAKQMERDGLDIPTAKAAAEKVYNRALYQNIADVAIFGWVMQAAWNLGAYLPYLFMGDDDDDKKEMLTDAALHAIAGGIEGLTGGSVMSDTYNTIRSGEANMYSNELLPLLSDIESLKRTFKKDVIEGANDLVNLIIQAGVGVNPQTITDWVTAGLDAVHGDPRLANEYGLLVMRIMSAPQGQLDKLYIDELGLTAGEAKQLNAEEFANRYARYKMGRESTFTGWAYSEEGRNDAFDRYVKNFDKKLKERIDAQDIETLADAYDRGDGHMKGLIEKAIKKKIAELDDTALQSMTSNNGNGKITKIVRSEINKRAKAKAAGMTPEEFSEFNKRVKASVANASDDELRDMYNQADTLARKIIRTALDESIDPEVGDPYKSPNKEYGRIYNRIKTADDMEEDILLAKAQKVAKAAGDDDLAKEIASARSELTEYRKELTGGAGDAQVMKELREARKELINEYVKSK